MQIKKSHQNKKKSSKNADDLPTSLKRIKDLLDINPTSKYVIKSLKKDKRIVARDINRLIKLGLIERIDHGVYKVIKSHQKIQGGQPSHQGSYFRLHNLEIALRLSGDSYNQLKNIIFRDLKFFDVHEFGNAGHYFSYLVTGLITKENVFIFFPEDFEIVAYSQSELANRTYSVIMDVLSKWESKFKLCLSKEGRFNFDIRNIHIAVVDKGVVRELESKDISFLSVVDDEDGRRRFVIDFSKGLPEVEAVHPGKAYVDSEEVRFLLKSVGDGDYRKLHDTYPGFMDALKSFVEGQTKVNFVFDSFVRVQTAMLEMQHNAMKDMEAKNKVNENFDVKEKPEYVG